MRGNEDAREFEAALVERGAAGGVATATKLFLDDSTNPATSNPGNKCLAAARSPLPPSRARVNL